ncbi:MAG TPA: alpha/beta hydrolase domain-containing protein [Steroidobacteraceae bacterium]|nr:alpha/beta hydrolase domain-containing protein [Steroidobacteraceae bacterium]
MSRSGWHVFLALLVGALALGTSAEAAVTRIEVTSRSDVLGGQRFGSVGSYERLSGRVYFTVSVSNAHNRGIVDLEKAENLKGGQVAFAADFIALRPKEASRGNGSLLLEIPNRGRVRIVSLVDGGDPQLSRSVGDAWLLRSGYTIVSLGWQWDAVGEGALRLYAPVARDGRHHITGLLRGDIMPSRVMAEIPLGHDIIGEIGGAEYPVAAPDDPRDVLSVRPSRDAPRTLIPRSQWQFAQSDAGRLVPSNRFIHLTGGFQPGRIYEYIYVVSDPVVAGLGFAAVRDFAAYVKHVRGALLTAQRVYGEGISQNGRFLRDFLYQGFNADEQGRRALDGVLAHVAGAGRGSFNYRFAQPSRDAEPTSSVDFPTDIFPFTDLPERDPATGATGALLARAVAEHVEPKVFFSDTSHEYWGRAASLIHTSADAKRDWPISSNVRIYFFTGLQHFSGPFPPARGVGDLKGQEPESPLPIRFFWRAMIANMDAWVRGSAAPPASRYPHIADHTLVPLAEYAFPAIPGVHLPHEVSTGYRLDFGPDWQERGILSLQPPRVEGTYPTLVPQADADGNALAGVHLPEITVPLATYTGWNLRDPSIGAPEERVPFEGSYLPFARTAAERRASGDPRRSIAERYRSRAAYLQRYAAATDALIRERWILPEDRARLLERGAREWAVAMGGEGGSGNAASSD